jgi:DoxX-like family
VPKRVYWVSTGLLSVLMLLSGAGDLLRFPPFVEDLRRLGYPDYLLTLLGTLKLLGVAALLYPGLPRLTEWAYAGFAFDLWGATISQLVSGSSAAQVLPPALCGSLVAISYIAYRVAGPKE